MKIKLISLLILSVIIASQTAKSEDSFLVEDIKVNGLQRISAGTVYNYIAVDIGEQFSLDNANTAIKSLFKTGFFNDIALEREGSTLIINVEERPSIAKIIFEGNNDLSTDDLTKALKEIGLAEGEVFNRQILDKVEQELRRQYFSHGKYSLKINTEVSKLTKNRVGIHITISEGRVAKIKQVNIVGNHVYDNEILLKEFELSSTGWLSFYSKNDQYSKQKLSADLERLRSFYLDRGYINFSIDSTQVAITPDKKEIYITVNVSEGDLFVLGTIKLSGNLVIEPAEMIALVKVRAGTIFSRKNATKTSKAITDRLGREGYIFANVNMVPEIDNTSKTVKITFFVDPGKRVYVRRINITGNTKTRDEVLRRELRQMEASWASIEKIERSKTRLDRLGYFQDVNIETPSVTDSSDQIDVNYSVTEKSSGQLTAGIGFSRTQGLTVNTNISQDNVFGSGKRVDLAFNNSDVSTRYSLGYQDPYFTLDGISFGYNLGYSVRDANAANVSNYSTDVINSSLNLGIPLNENDNLRFSASLKHTNLTTPRDRMVERMEDGEQTTSIATSSDQVRAFEERYGKQYLNLLFSVGWTHDTLNKAVFPTTGGQQRLFSLISFPGSDLEYYKISYKQQQYFPITEELTIRLLGELAYGAGYGSTDELPFFEHFFAGGVRSIRGFDDNTIGPRDSTGRPFGGSSKVIAKAEMFFPVPFIDDIKSVRLGVFFDSGAVSDGLGIDGLRYSVGFSGEWLSPLGPLAVSFSLPFGADEADETQSFQFSFGAGF